MTGGRRLSWSSLVLMVGYVVVTTLFDSSINSRGTARNRGISGERGDEYRDRNAPKPIGRVGATREDD